MLPFRGYFRIREAGVLGVLRVSLLRDNGESTGR